MRFEDVQVGQMFHYDELYKESWMVVNKTKDKIEAIYLVNYGGQFYIEPEVYDRKQWNDNDYFKAYVSAMRQAGYNVTVDEPKTKYKRSEQ